MNKLQEAVSGTKGFLGEVGSEMRKTTWPEREELIGSTAVVIVSVIMMSVFVGVSDKILMTLLKLLTSLT